MVDREGNRATMKVEEFNAFVEAVVSKKVTKI